MEGGAQAWRIAAQPLVPPNAVPVAHNDGRRRLTTHPGPGKMDEIANADSRR